MYKHYVRINSDSNVIDAFSDAHKIPLQTDILIVESEDRHFFLDIYFFNLYTTVYNYRYTNNQLIKKTASELDTEIEQFKQNVNNKRIQLKKVSTLLLDKYKFISSIYVIQKYGHDLGINTKPKILLETDMNNWAIWYEKIYYLFDTVNLTTVNYDDIHINNTDIFPVPPSVPIGIVMP